MTARRRFQIRFVALAASLIALVVAAPLLLGGGGGSDAGDDDPAPVTTDAPATDAPSNLGECLEQLGLEDVIDPTDPHGGSASQEDLQLFFENCLQFLHESSGP
jgi:hypothetical protein